VDTVFGPLVHLSTGEVVGYEALVRGPSASLVESPLALLSAARAVGRLEELDWLCAARACEAATAAKLHPSMTIFLNFEPATLLTQCPPDLLDATRRAQDLLRVVVEVKEASLTDDPGRLFDAVAAIRETGWGIAIDNAIAAQSTIALLPLVQPDVLKLDLSNAHGDLHAIAEMTEGAQVYAEGAGAKILVERIETDDDLHVARFAGASYGQGWHLGHPGPIAESKMIPRAVFPLLTSNDESFGATPFEIVATAAEVGHTEKRFLTALARHLENQVDAHGPRGLLLVSFEQRFRPSRATIERLTALAERSAFTGLLGVDDELRSPTFRCSQSPPGDPIADEWNVIVLGPHYSAALVARGWPADEEGPSRRFDYSVTHNRELVTAAARSLLRSLGHVHL
jgi:EAL domain-containing protein (putative c-di-GMP-specific phosphodiesterase class I)